MIFLELINTQQIASFTMIKVLHSFTKTMNTDMNADTWPEFMIKHAGETIPVSSLPFNTAEKLIVISTDGQVFQLEPFVLQLEVNSVDAELLYDVINTWRYGKYIYTDSFVVSPDWADPTITLPELEPEPEPEPEPEDSKFSEGA